MDLKGMGESLKQEAALRAAAPTPQQIESIKQRWPDLWRGVIESQTQVVQWLFTVPGVGIAGTLTIAAAGTRNAALILSLFLFVGALVAIVVYGATMYYSNRSLFYRFKLNVENLYTGKITSKEFDLLDAKLPMEFKMGETLSWISGVSSLLGIILLIVSVLSAK